jgi:hypothetical protein
MELLILVAVAVVELIVILDMLVLAETVVVE